MWKDIKGFENKYFISEDGKVKNSNNEIMKTQLVGRGYEAIRLYKDSKYHRYYIHRLVAEHYIEKGEEFECVNHLDGNKLNNHYSNLEWTTYSKNNQHAYDNNLRANGKSHYKAKLSDEQVIEIIIEGKGNKTYQEIADKYNVTKATIRDILVKNTWKHLHTKLEKCNDYSERK